MDLSFASLVFGALFAVMNPFANLPIFLGLTDGMSEAERRATALSIAAASAVACAVVSVAGAAILGFFDISIDAFRVAGGLVLGHIGFTMLGGSDSASHHGTHGEQAEMEARESIAFYPMTFPMLVGPGTITTLILYSHKAGELGAYPTFAAVAAAVLAMLGAVFYFGGLIGRVLSQTARSVMTRLMGMILLAIAVGMVAEGGGALLPGLAGGAG